MPAGMRCNPVLTHPHPADPKTVAWLQDNFDPVFGFPNVARFSWAPVKNALLKKGAASKWCVPVRTAAGPQHALYPWRTMSLVRKALTRVLSCRDDEPSTIQKYFSGQPAGADRAPLFKDYNLVSVGEF